MNRIKKNDMVYVTAGKDKGKSGRVLKVFPSSDKCIVEGVNLCKKHMRQTRQDRPGGIVEKENPLNMSNVMPYCSKCKTGVRVRYNVLDDGSKIKVCSKCKETV